MNIHVVLILAFVSSLCGVSIFVSITCGLFYLFGENIGIITRLCLAFRLACNISHVNSGIRKHDFLILLSKIYVLGFLLS